MVILNITVISILIVIMVILVKIIIVTKELCLVKFKERIAKNVKHFKTSNDEH
jgi:hypothetical protein